MEYQGLSLQEACDRVVYDKLVKIGGEGGLIAIGQSGVPVLAFNSEGMYRGWQIQGRTQHLAIYK
jgi:beta-aspartyl-peptidase (threonine type)